MSQLNLVHVTNRHDANNLGIPVHEVEGLQSLAQNSQNGTSWIINEKNIFNSIATGIIQNSEASILSAFRDINIIAKKNDFNQSFQQIILRSFKNLILINPKTDLKLDEIIEITQHEEHPEDFVIGGNVNADIKTITLFRGDFSVFYVPFDRFKKNGRSTPNFKKFRIIDNGRTIQLGNYEASVYPLLYEIDSSYRQRIKQQRKKSEVTFGACLYRARIIKNITQDAFPGVRRETILRIENEKSKRVQKKTKEAILKTLNISEQELLSY